MGGTGQAVSLMLMLSLAQSVIIHNYYKVRFLPPEHTLHFRLRSMRFQWPVSNADCLRPCDMTPSLPRIFSQPALKVAEDREAGFVTFGKAASKVAEGPLEETILCHCRDSQECSQEVTKHHRGTL
ncbi:hypothetical protein JB92DRAFT_1527586 [Gautieria morchelliformis]|nr:hypothetical protein JB92DRAFT_1527586 [Gautieria morchelliformis]